MQSVIIVSVITLIVIVPSVIMLGVIILSVIMLSIIILSALILSVIMLSAMTCFLEPVRKMDRSCSKQVCLPNAVKWLAKTKTLA